MRVPFDAPSALMPSALLPAAHGAEDDDDDSDDADERGDETSVAASLPRFGHIDEPAFAVHAHLLAQRRGTGGKAAHSLLLSESVSAPALKMRRAADRAPPVPVERLEMSVGGVGQR